MERKLRRNGKPPSCEPCRKAKIRCDHGSPTCAKCQRRNIRDKCSYHPAPMTRRYSPADKELIQSTSTTPSKPSSPSATNITDVQNDESFTNSNINGATQTQSGYLGSTSYAAVFEYDQSQFDPIPSTRSIGSPYLSHGTSKTHITPGTIRGGARILAYLSDLKFHEDLINSFYALSQTMIVPKPFMKAAFASIQNMHELALRDSTGTTFYRWSEAICRNSVQPFEVNEGTTVQEFIASFTGQNLRWEIMGMIFTLSGLVMTTFIDRNKLPIKGEPQGLDRKKFITQMEGAAEFCIHFSQSVGSVNDLLVWLLYEHFVLLSMFHGDSDYRTWRGSGELSSLLFAMGLHQDPKVEQNTPFFLTQLRKRSFGNAYSSDKGMATFLGRPPRISRRYCSCSLPLELSDEEILFEGPALHSVLQKLDENGWSTNETDYHRGSWCRVRLLANAIREDVLELCLGAPHQHEEDAVERVRQISQKSADTWQALPARMRYDPECWRNKSRSGNSCYISLIHYLDYLFTDFLLQRFLVKNTRATPEALLSVSKRLMSAMITLCMERDRIIEVKLDAASTIAAYGLTPAGTLAVELLRHARNLATIRLPISRSAVIQDISVFISTLGWAVRPRDGNYQVCVQARDMLRRILDEVLEGDGGGGGGFGGNGGIGERGGGNGNDVGGEEDGGFMGIGSGGGGEIRAKAPPPVSNLSMENAEEFLAWLESEEWNMEPYITI
ncbi:MAG: hypothetical protein M1834_000578 [Cirrosporium novae-zelandiae]|nr:MAG: hypothetical protein M1834_000578 [Cirrosporium novae-zelandiae]